MWFVREHSVGFDLQARFTQEAEKYSKQTDLTRRVQEWEAKIRPILDEQVGTVTAKQLSFPRMLTPPLTFQRMARLFWMDFRKKTRKSPFHSSLWCARSLSMRSADCFLPLCSWCVCLSVCLFVGVSVCLFVGVCLFIRRHELGKLWQCRAHTVK